MLDMLRRKNPGLRLFRVSAPEFADYGRLLNVPDLPELTAVAKSIPLPERGSRYDASLPQFEQCAAADFLRGEIFGQLATQTGYCCGYNNRLDALEWHKSSEINIAVTSFVLLLGRLQDIGSGQYDSGLIKGFLLEPGDCVEIYATTLHFCPCQTEKQGFGCIVALPQGTNLPLDKPAEDPLLFRKNKWIIAHEQNAGLTARGVKAGVFGENWEVECR